MPFFIGIRKSDKTVQAYFYVAIKGHKKKVSMAATRGNHEESKQRRSELNS